MKGETRFVFDEELGSSVVLTTKESEIMNQVRGILAKSPGKTLPMTAISNRRHRGNHLTLKGVVMMMAGVKFIEKDGKRINGPLVKLDPETRNVTKKNGVTFRKFRHVTLIK